MSMRNYFRRLAEGYENGFCAATLKPFLEIGSWAYGAGSGISRTLYENKIFKREKLPFPVISVGNLTWGGTGKTPFVEYLAQKIAAAGRAGLILTRGYGKDESEQLRGHLPSTIIGAGKDRVKIAADVLKKQRVDIGILDDGFQHWRVQRDLEILMVNALNPYGNGRLIPVGILREPQANMKRAEIIVISHANLITAKELTELREEISKHAPQAAIVETYLEPLFFYRAKKKVRVAINRLENQRVTTFSAVAAPRSFQMLLTRMHIKPTRNFEFTDHHHYKEKELKEIRDVSLSAGAGEIITTEKDFYRCPDLIADTLNPLVLATKVHVTAGEEVLNERLNRLLGVTG